MQFIMHRAYELNLEKVLLLSSPEGEDFMKLSALKMCSTLTSTAAK